ncbi:MAG: type IV secretion system protein [Pelagibacterales bacterium]|nr:type IV secretion system protein [Pelagibacterales bacterium]
MPLAKNSNKKNELKVKSWYSNRYQIVVVQRNILFIFTLVSMMSVAVAVFFVKHVMASKSLEPYVIEVEEKTGIATVVDQLTAQSFTGNQVVRQYFINQFIHAASGYNPKTYKEDAEKIRLFSTPGIYSEFRGRINPRALGVDAAIDVRIKSIQFPDNNTAQIRLLKQINYSASKVEQVNEVITMTFYFTDVNLTIEERLINPLGFQVSQYLIAEEKFDY